MAVVDNQVDHIGIAGLVDELDIVDRNQVQEDVLDNPVHIVVGLGKVRMADHLELGIDREVDHIVDDLVVDNLAAPDDTEVVLH